MILLIRVHFFTTTLEKFRRSPRFFYTQITYRLKFEKRIFGSKSTRNNAQQLIVHSVIREQPNILSHGHQSITFVVISWSQEGNREGSEVKKPMMLSFWERFHSVILEPRSAEILLLKKWIIEGSINGQHKVNIPLES